MTSFRLIMTARAPEIDMATMTTRAGEIPA